MPEISIRLPVDEGRISLEGFFQEGRNSRTAIICHPHPVYGGNMDNNVVVAVQRVFAERGWGTLRYNFRGVGASGGKSGQGTTEAEDLVDVATFIESIHPGALDLAGYSYGSWTVLTAVRRGLSPDLLCLFSPPLDFMSFEGLVLPDRPTLITLGNQDEFCSVGSLRKWLANQPLASRRVTLELIAYCDHFYWEFGADLSARLDGFLRKNLQVGFA